MTKAANKILAGAEDALAFIKGNDARGTPHTVDVVDVKAVRTALKLSQAAFSKALMIPLDTLQNWEQGRRQPQGPARVLLHALKNDPKAVLEAINR